MNKKLTLFLFIMAISNWTNAADKIKKLDIVREFPTEAQMLKGGFALGQGIKFDILENKIYFCSQFECKLIVFDLDGNYLTTIGSPGQGPGDFNWPLNIFAYRKSIYISDNGNARIQILSGNGDFERQIKIINVLHDFVIVNDKIFLSCFDKTSQIDRVHASIFKIFDLNGNLLKNISGPFKAIYDNYVYNNSVTLRIDNVNIHCLQKYGTTYRVYNENGELQREFSLNKNPLDDKKYKKIKYKGAYVTFCVYDSIIYATYAGRGELIIDAFNMDGQYICSYSATQKDEEIYLVSDMKVLEYNGKKYLYLLIDQPDIYFAVAAIENKS